MTTTMKNWQKNIEIQLIDEVVAFYEDYNKNYCLSPFTEINRPKAATIISDGTLKVYRACDISQQSPQQFDDKMYDMVGTMIVKPIKVKTVITELGHPVGYKFPGDFSVSNVNHNGDLAVIDEMIREIRLLFRKTDTKTIHLEYNPENKIEIRFVERLKEIGGVVLAVIGHKYASTGEVFRRCVLRSADFVYIEPGISFVSSFYNPVPEWKNVGITKVSESPLIQKAINRFDFPTLMDQQFMNHYSNYNKGKSWSAISVKGFSSDPMFIEKPSEVMKSKKLRGKYEGKEFKLQTTQVYYQFRNEIDSLLAVLGLDISDKSVERVRFMRLAPGHGELQRHTDQVDEEMGLESGKMLRFHFPIITNPDVVFTTWPCGIECNHRMKVGNAYILDVRKPHRAINGGTDYRIHLVIDAWWKDEFATIIDYGMKNYV